MSLAMWKIYLFFLPWLLNQACLWRSQSGCLCYQMPKGGFSEHGPSAGEFHAASLLLKSILENTTWNKGGSQGGSKAWVILLPEPIIDPMGNSGMQMALWVALGWEKGDKSLYIHTTQVLAVRVASGTARWLWGDLRRGSSPPLRAVPRKGISCWEPSIGDTYGIRGNQHPSPKGQPERKKIHKIRKGISSAQSWISSGVLLWSGWESFFSPPTSHFHFNCYPSSGVYSDILPSPVRHPLSYPKSQMASLWTDFNPVASRMACGLCRQRYC